MYPIDVATLVHYRVGIIKPNSDVAGLVYQQRAGIIKPKSDVITHKMKYFLTNLKNAGIFELVQNIHRVSA